MNAWSKVVAATIAGSLSALVTGAAANAGEITVVASGGPLPDVMGTLVPMFEKTTGNKVKISFNADPQSPPMSNRGLRTSPSPTPRLSPSCRSRRCGR
jgi:ABC-type glycerol-3-phosphate transport system substrate-binding protein